MARGNIDSRRYASHMESRIPQPTYNEKVTMRNENRQYSSANLLQTDFQQRLLKEKENNMIKIHEANQKRALSKVKKYQDGYEGYERNRNNRARPDDLRNGNGRAPARADPYEYGHEVTRYNRAARIDGRRDDNTRLERNDYDNEQEAPPFPVGPRQHHRPLKQSAGKDKSNLLAPLENTEQRRQHLFRKKGSDNLNGTDLPVKAKMARSTQRNINNRGRYNSESESEYRVTPDANAALIEDEIKRKEQELLAKIQQQQVELDRIKRDREREEEEARREEEREKKRQVAKEASRRRLQQKINDEDSYNTYKSTPPPRDRSPPPEEYTAPPQRERAPPKPTPVVRKQQPIKRTPPRPARTPIQEQSIEEEIPIQPGAYDISNLGTEGQYQKVDLKPCPNCGRKFAKDRLDKHKAACKQASKKRKVFDPVKMRAEGTENAEYMLGNNNKKRNKKSEPPKRKADWRSKHEEFIKNIRYAKQVSKAEAEGRDISAIAPPPPTENPDYVQCPYCKRTFNETAAARHIPRCKDTKARPAPPPRKR